MIGEGEAKWEDLIRVVANCKKSKSKAIPVTGRGGL
jgi:hypothetical protein